MSLAPRTKTNLRHWLMKSEPDVYSIDDLVKDGTTSWEGVRNYQARNFMRDEMKVGDLVLFYHSNAKPPGVAGVARVCREAYPDPTQFDPKSDYFDARSSDANPRWMMVDVGIVERFDELLPLDRLRSESPLDGMELLRKGSRLSVQKVEKSHFRHILTLAGSTLRL